MSVLQLPLTGPKLTVEEIAKKIKAKQWPTEIRDWRDYCIFVNNEWVPDLDKRNQCRTIMVDWEIVNELVAKIESDNKNRENLDPLTVVYYPSETENNEKVSDGNHTVLAGVRTGEKDNLVYIVDFEKHLDSNPTLVRRLSNLLNNNDKIKVQVSQEDLRNEFYDYLDYRAEQGLSTELTADERAKWAEPYTQINARITGQWQANYKNGSRTAPTISWTQAALDAQLAAMKQMSTWSGFEFLEYHTLPAWNGQVLATILKKITENTKCEKILIPFYCSTKSQADDAADTKFHEKMKKLYEQIGNRIKVEIKYDILKWENDEENSS